MDYQYLEFLEILKNKKIIIYGAGYIGKNLFYKALAMHGLLCNIKAFCVTKLDSRNKFFGGIPVREIGEIEPSEEEIICVAVHESIKDEMVKILEARGFNNYLWIYPYLFQLFLGEADKKGTQVSVNEIIKQTCKNDYGIPIRYAMLEYYYGKNNWGQDVYIKSREVWSGRENALVRVQNYVNLIESWGKKGYESSKRIYIFDNYELFDGAHRLVLAKYFKQESITCDIWKKRIDLTELYGENAVCSKGALYRWGFEQFEIERLDEIKERLCDS